MATFRIRRANLIPMQFLGPAPKGRYVYGSMDSLFSLLNLEDGWGKEMKAPKPQNLHILFILGSLTAALQSLVWVFPKVSQATPKTVHCSQALVRDRVESHLRV